jgi:hypothetical protein
MHTAGSCRIARGVRVPCARSIGCRCSHPENVALDHEELSVCPPEIHAYYVVFALITVLCQEWISGLLRYQTHSRA